MTILFQCSSRSNATSPIHRGIAERTVQYGRIHCSNSAVTHLMHLRACAKEQSTVL